MAQVMEEHDGRRIRGQRTRASILEAAADLASVEGLDGLTIGRLASELGLSKSGLFAHFGSKEDLQVATTDAAAERFRAKVVDPALEHPPGRARLDTLIAGWLDYMRSGVFPGGCFLTAVRAEFDSRPAGPVRDAIARDHRRWLRFIERTLRGAQEAGDLSPDADPAQLAYEIEALGVTANLNFQLHGDDSAFDRAATAIATRLERASAASAALSRG